jgi:hypothetical protein
MLSDDTGHIMGTGTRRGELYFIYRKLQPCLLEQDTNSNRFEKNIEN